MARWKARVRLPIRHNCTFFASSYHWRATRQNVSKLTAFWRWWVSLSQDFRGRGRPSGIFLVSRKLGTFCYLIVQTAPCYVQSFWHNTVVWQTDWRTDWQTNGQTEGIAIASTALAMRALRRAVITSGIGDQTVLFAGIIMVALWNRADHYIFALRFLSSFFPRLISAVGDWMSTILPHMVWP